MTEYPPSSFYYQLSITDSSSIDYSFQEVSGLKLEKEPKEIKTDGENRFTYKIPTNVKYQNLILKRGLAPQNSELIKWCTDTMNGVKTVDIKNIKVALLNEKKQVLKTWSVYKAWPIKWDVSSLNSMNEEIVIESLEFAFDSIDDK